MSSLGLSRSILLSVVTIAAMLAVFATATTFAAFTSSDSDSGEVTAGTVSIEVLGTGTLNFTGGSLNCPSAIAPGDICGPDEVTVTNNGDLAVTLSDPVVSATGDLSTCDGGGHLGATTGAQSYTADSTVLAPGEFATFEISAALDGVAGNDCQSQTGTVTVEVTATST